MMLRSFFLWAAFLVSLGSCKQQAEAPVNSPYSSAITFLYYQDFAYGTQFMEEVLELELVMNQDFARVYEVNEKAFLGIVKQRDSTAVAGNTLFSLTTRDVNSAYERFKQLTVQELTEIKYFESIPLKSFFFEDLEGHKFEIQQFLKEDDQQKF
jgi:hypothetical protein